jgi:hypothetical protein
VGGGCGGREGEGEKSMPVTEDKQVLDVQEKVLVGQMANI